MRETSFKEKVEKYLKQQNAWYIKYWAGNNFTKEGIPDILACIEGTFYGIELKSDKGRPKLLQLKKLRDIRDSGGVGILLYPEDFENFKEFVKGTTAGEEWYSENKAKQYKLFEKLNHK